MDAAPRTAVYLLSLDLRLKTHKYRVSFQNPDGEFEEVENIGQRIKEIRKSKSITIQKLSQFTDLSVGYLSNLERNQASPTLSNLQRICVALGISIRDLLRPSGDERTLIRQEEQQGVSPAFRIV